jgi:hypothetical protein
MEDRARSRLTDTQSVVNESQVRQLIRLPRDEGGGGREETILGVEQELECIGSQPIGCAIGRRHGFFGPNVILKCAIKSTCTDQIHLLFSFTSFCRFCSLRHG